MGSRGFKRFQSSRVHKNPPKNAAVNAPSQLFKVQRPLFTTGDKNQLLIYNEDHSIECTLVVEEQTMIQIFFAHNPEGVHKVFVMASTNKLGQLVIDYILDEEDWPLW